MRAIVAAGGTIDHDWTLPQALAIGDKATNTHVLTDLYAQWKDAPVQYDLPALWTQLGIVFDLAIRAFEILEHRTSRRHSRGNHQAQTKSHPRNRPVLATTSFSAAITP